MPAVPTGLRCLAGVEGERAGEKPGSPILHAQADAEIYALPMKNADPQGVVRLEAMVGRCQLQEHVPGEAVC